MNHQANRKQLKMRKLEDPFLLTKVAIPTFTLALTPTTSTTATSMATLPVPPTTATATLPLPFTTAKAILLVSSKPPSTLNTTTMPKPQNTNQTSKTWPRPYTLVPLTAPVHSNWSSGEDWKETEEEKKRPHQTNLLFLTLLTLSQNYSLTNPPAPAPEERERPQEKQKDQVTNYYPSEPIYIPSYEEDAPYIVNNLI